MSTELITIAGWGCVAWTLLEFARLGARARRIARFRAPRFHARDDRGEPIDVDIVS